MGRPKLDDIQDSTFAFRISSEEKSELEDLVMKKQTALNNKREANRNKVTKNDVIARALRIGLRHVKLEDLPYREKQKKQEK